ncbi:hypothetical protein MT418_006620 [Batrachochytrium dendrobatidis]
MMKLLIAILSSTLIACSVTTATPVVPSRTANFESSSATIYPSTSTFVDLNVNSVNCGDYSKRRKKAVKKYAKAKYDVELIREKCKLILTEIVDQKTVVKNLRERVELMSPVTTPSDDDPDYTETQSLLQSENDALANLQNQQIVCNREYYAECKKLRLAERKLARKFFGTFNFSFGRVSSERMMDLLTSQTFLDCFSQFYPSVPSSSTDSEDVSTSGTQTSTDSEGASTSGTQGSSSRPHGPPPSYGVVMRKPKLYKVTQYSPGDQPPSYQDVVRNPQNFPEVLEDPDVTESSSMSPSIVHPTQTSSSVPPSQHTASSSLTWKADRS